MYEVSDRIVLCIYVTVYLIRIWNGGKVTSSLFQQVRDGSVSHDKESRDCRNTETLPESTIPYPRREYELTNYINYSFRFYKKLYHFVDF